MRSPYHADKLTELSSFCDSIERQILRYNNGSKIHVFETTRIVDEIHLLIRHRIHPKNPPHEYELGYNYTLGHLIPTEDNEPNVPIFPSNGEIHQYTHNLLHACGRLAEVRRCIDAVHAGLMSFDTDQRGHSLFMPISSGIELIDNISDQLQISKINDSISQLLDPEVQERWKIAKKEMRSKVKIWRDHYITHKWPSRSTEEYFDIKASGIMLTLSNDIMLPLNFEVLPGISYGLALDALHKCIAWRLTHMSYAQILLENNPDLNIRNLITTFSEEEKIVKAFSESLGCNIKTSKKLLGIFAADKNKMNAYATGKMSAPPLFVSFGNHFFLESFAGINRPTLLLHESLRTLSPAAWDQSTDAREKVFRHQLYNLINEIVIDGSRFESHWSGVNISKSKRVLTDLDALIIDKKTGDIAIFQLKWQEPFALSIRQRKSKGSNFISTCNKWVNTVLDWLNSTENPENRIGLRLPHDPKRKWFIFVIGRNSVHLSGANYDRRAAWGSWADICDATQGAETSTHPLRYIHEKLQRFFVESQNLMKSPPTVMNEFNLNNRKFSIAKLGGEKLNKICMKLKNRS